MKSSFNQLEESPGDVVNVVSPHVSGFLRGYWYDFNNFNTVYVVPRSDDSAAAVHTTERTAVEIRGKMGWRTNLGD